MTRHETADPFGLISGVRFYRRYDRDGFVMDEWGHITTKGCDALSKIWLIKLKLGTYSKVEFMLANGQRVFVRQLKAKTNLLTRVE